MGLPTVSIENLDNTEAHYSGMAYEAKVIIPFTGRRKFEVSTSLNYKLLNLENNSNNNNQKETADHSGYGLGLHLKYSKLMLGLDYYFMTAEHYWVGNFSNDQELFGYNSFNYYFGFEVPISKSAGLIIQYNINSGSISDDDINAGNSSTFNESTIWFTIRFSTGKPLNRLF